MKAQYEARIKNLPLMIAFIRDNLNGLEFDPDCLHSIELACEEALVNIIRHGYPTGTGDISLDCQLISDNGIKIIISDQGIPFNPLENVKAPITPLPKIESQQLGGYGIYFILELMDKVEYERKNNHNILILIKYCQKERY